LILINLRLQFRGHCRDPPLSRMGDTKFFEICIKHKLFTCNQRDVQKPPVGFQFFPWNALNKDMFPKQGGPNRRKIISLAEQLGALTREITSSLL
jgi:hypothetical protein